ncbi:protein of unknown function [Pricia antarctica]|uniref:eCIS core domain-containing protein n=1 Tax=Pricia antarctica TaxID=641691 RepID=A0A1G6YTQ2_9FLAO|nr:DUF4157 domain-containing protein [Pricia antarctica]SDD93662.1 protein of unknown function [Pricia antarctica]
MANELHPTTLDEDLYTDEYLSIGMKTTADKTTHHTHLDAHRHGDQDGAVATMFIPPTVQTKLTVNTPGDPFEQEADTMANRVMAGSANTQMEEGKRVRLQEEEEEEKIQRSEEEEEETLQRMEEEEETVQRTEDEEEEKVQRKEEEEVQRKEEENEVQRKGEEDKEGELQRVEEEPVQRSENWSTHHGGTTAPSIVSEVVSSSGQIMDKGTQGTMENSFGTDFSSVRIHNDDKAQTSAKSISAQAYTYGSHIVFARGKYEPHTSSGKHLLAHELTHVMQQGAAVKRRVDPDASTVNGHAATVDIATAESPTALVPVPDSEVAPASSPEAGLENVPAAEGGPLPTQIELEPIMPPPPESLNPEAQSRLNRAQNNAGTAASNNAELPPASELADEARGGVTEPISETEGRASGQLTAALNQRVAPSPEIEELCDNIRRVIREKRPPDEDSLLQADPEEAANEAGSQLNENIDSDVDRVDSEYDELDESPTGETEQIGDTVELPPEEVGEPNINAQGAAPDPLTEDEVSLEADVAASAEQMQQAGMITPVTEVIPDGPIAEARAVHGELEETAAEDPALVLLEQEEALGNARTDMEALQQRALLALENARAGSVRDSGTQQTDMVESETDQRDALGIRAEELFTGAQQQVNDLLTPLTETAMNMWETGKTRIATEFEQHLARVQRWVDDRHSGFGGGITELWDDLTGLPDWVTDNYNDAEETFGDAICALIREISIYVNGIVVTCEEIITLANTAINSLFDNAPEELREWAETEKLRFQGRLDGLREEVTNTQQHFNRDLANRASQAVQEVREKVHALREAAKGLLGKIADAIIEFLEDPIRAIINGLLRLVGIEPAAFWALIARIEQVISDIANDPLGFASNLLAAIGAGFQKFFDNFFNHLFEGFISWIFSGLGAVGVEIPPDFSLKSIITFFLQLMGITWERIRMLLARHIGEENVALLEQAYEIISDLIELGPQGVFELIKEKLDPRQILDQVIEMAVNFVIETLVTQATIRIVALFNPVGAIAQAIEAIYKVLKWIFENAARIFTLVETVVNGIADIIAGNIAGMATAVESALKQLLVPVIDFVASFMGLGDLPEKVAEMVKGLQDWVEGILDTVIGFLATQARNLLSALGISEDADPEAEEEAAAELEDTEVGEVVQFNALGEHHRLWIDTDGSSPKVMMASNVTEVDTVLKELDVKAENGTEEDAPEKVDEAQTSLQAVIDNSTEAQEAIQNAQDEQPQEGEVEAAENADNELEAQEHVLANNLADAIQATEEPPLPETWEVTPDGFPNSTADTVEVKKVVAGNHPDGSTPGAGTLADAWEVISNFGLNAGATWVRFHIFNHNIGGAGRDSNLIPTPRYVNNNYRSFETPMKNYHDTEVPVWFLGMATYYSDNPLFVQEFSAVGGGMKYENGDWVEDSDKEISEFRDSPGFPEPLKIAINSILTDDMLMWNTVSNLTPLSINILTTLKDNIPGGGYTSNEQLQTILQQNLSDGSYKTQILTAMSQFESSQMFTFN